VGTVCAQERFGNRGTFTTRQESKHARRRRMQAAKKTPRCKKKKKQDVIKKLYQSHFAAGSGVFYDNALRPLAIR
jgi:hypothetical protein